MPLKINNYLLYPETQVPGKFNLYQKTKSKPKDGGEGKETETHVAYAVTLSRALDIIATETIQKKEIEDLKAYVDAREAYINNLLLKLKPIEKLLYENLKNKNE